MNVAAFEAREFSAAQKWHSDPITTWIRPLTAPKEFVFSLRTSRFVSAFPSGCYNSLKP